MNWRSTKFQQAAFIQLTGAVALFARIIDGSTYVALSTIALGIYGAADVSDRYLQTKAASK